MEININYDSFGIGYLLKYLFCSLMESSLQADDTIILALGVQIVLIEQVKHHYSYVLKIQQIVQDLL